MNCGRTAPRYSTGSTCDRGRARSILAAARAESSSSCPNGSRRADASSEWTPTRPRHHGQTVRRRARTSRCRDRGSGREAHRAAVRVVRPRAQSDPAGHDSGAHTGGRGDGTSGEAGGWVASLEPDTEHALCYPAHPAFDRIGELFHAAFRRNGADPFIGRRLAELYREAGLEDIGVETRDPVHRQGTRGARSGSTSCAACARSSSSEASPRNGSWTSWTERSASTSPIRIRSSCRRSISWRGGAGRLRQEPAHPRSAVRLNDACTRLTGRSAAARSRERTAR